MNKIILKVIQNAIKSNDKQLFPLNKAWQYLHENYNVGRTQGNKLEITSKDKSELICLVKLETGIDLEKFEVSSFSEMNREEALTVGINEKLAGQCVKKDRLALKTICGHPLSLNEKFYELPGCGHLDVSLADIEKTTHDCIMIIENYRCFDRLQNINLSLPAQCSNPLVIYRGDNVYSEKAVRQILARLALPVMVMADIDPKGLEISQSFLGFSGLVAPSLNDIESLLQCHNTANHQLYVQQFADCQELLSKSPYPVIRQFWQLLKRYKAGIVQEHWLISNNSLALHDF